MSIVNPGNKHSQGKRQEVVLYGGPLHNLVVPWASNSRIPAAGTKVRLPSGPAMDPLAHQTTYVVTDAVDSFGRRIWRAADGRELVPVAAPVPEPSRLFGAQALDAALNELEQEEQDRCGKP